MTKTLHILVMSGGWQSALSCIQSFGRNGHAVSVLLSRFRSPNYASVFVRHVLHLKEPVPDERVRELKHLVEEKDIDLVVPVSDEDAALVSRARQLFPESRAFISGPLESVLIARSRNKTTELCRGLNIDIPKTLFVTHDDAIDAASELGFPCFLKLSDTVASHGVFEILNKAQLAQELASIPARTEMQLQAAVEGDFVDITGFALGGKVLESFAFRCDYIHSHGGTPAYTHRLNDERLSHILSKIAAQLGWTGGLDLDLLRRKDGSLALLEINPRFSGTAVFPFKLGMDFPMYFVNAHLGINQTPLRRDGRPNAERFVSLIEETSYLSGAGGAGQKQANDFRADNKWVDSAFWDDKGYSAALFNHVRRILLKPKRALRQTNSTIR